MAAIWQKDGDGIEVAHSAKCPRHPRGAHSDPKLRLKVNSGRCACPKGPSWRRIVWVPGKGAVRSPALKNKEDAKRWKPPDPEGAAHAMTSMPPDARQALLDALAADLRREYPAPAQGAGRDVTGRVTQRPLEQVPRLALTRKEAAQSLGMSVDTFERRVQPFVKVIRTGQLVLVSPRELERWVRQNERYG